MLTKKYDPADDSRTLRFTYQGGTYFAGGDSHWWDMDMDCPAWRAFHDGANAPLKNYVHSHAGQIVYADLNEYGYLSVVIQEDEADAAFNGSMYSGIIEPELSGKDDITETVAPGPGAEPHSLFPANTPKANEAILDG